MIDPDEKADRSLRQAAAKILRKEAKAHKLVWLEKSCETRCCINMLDADTANMIPSKIFNFEAALLSDKTLQGDQCWRCCCVRLNMNIKHSFYLDACCMPYVEFQLQLLLVVHFIPEQTVQEANENPTRHLHCNTLPRRCMTTMTVERKERGNGVVMEKSRKTTKFRQQSRCLNWRSLLWSSLTN